MRTTYATSFVPRTIFERPLSTFLKGVAICLVLGCHIGNQFSRAFTPLGGIGVAVFLFFSGYGLTVSFYKSGLTNFWHKRLLAVFVPYFILQIATWWLHPWGDCLTFIKDITLLHPLMPMGWFLNYLLIWYVAFYVSILLSLKTPTRTVILLCFAFLMGWVSLHEHQPIRFEQSFSFVLGYLACTYSMDRYLNKSFALFAIVLALVGIVLKQIPAIRMNMMYLMFVDLSIKLFALWGILALVKSYAGMALSWKLISLAGQCAFEIYLVQAYLCGLFKSSLPKTMSVLLIILLTFPIAYIFRQINKLYQFKQNKN